MRSIEGKYEVDAHFAYAYGYTLMCEGEFIDALRWLRQAVTLNPSHARATLHLAHCLLMTGERVEGRRWAKQARHLGERSVYDSLKAG
ncbi:MAG: tetratricopeptide repeat protein [Deltaproteobacteria bacterium]|nr:tetratricopeptide repeat protein [Deltaproteobacteria bacterium]